MARATCCDETTSVVCSDCPRAPENDRGPAIRDIAEALKPYGYEWLVSVTGICGPGALIVVFATGGDFFAACLTHDNQVVWVMSSGASEVDSYIDEVNDLHRKTREFYRRKNG